MNKTRPNGQRAKTAITVLYIILGVEFISLISSYFQYEMLQSAFRGELITQEQAVANDNREMLIGYLSIVVTIIGAVTFIMWFRRAYFNLHQVTDNLTFSEGWASGAWFVPILNLFRPYQIMRELYVRTSALLAGNGISLTKDLNTSSVGTWWTLWVINSILGNVVFQLSRNAVSIGDFKLITMLSMISGILGIACGLAVIKVIKDYTANENLLEKITTNGEPVIINDDQNILA